MAHHISLCESNEREAFGAFENIQGFDETRGSRVRQINLSNIAGDHRLRVAVTAQACNNTQCLPPEEVRTGADVTVAPPGSSSSPANEEIFSNLAAGPADPGGSGGSSDLASRSLPLLLIGVFFAGLALNLTPCVFPLIPITIGFFTQQTKDRKGSTFPLALAYVLGIALTY